MPVNPFDDRQTNLNPDQPHARQPLHRQGEPVAPPADSPNATPPEKHSTPEYPPNKPSPPAIAESPMPTTPLKAGTTPPNRPSPPAAAAVPGTPPRAPSRAEPEQTAEERALDQGGFPKGVR